MLNNTTGASSATDASKSNIAANFHEEDVIEERSFEKEQEPVIAAGTAARKASKEAYTADFKAWERRMECQRAHWEAQQSKESW